MCPILQTGDGDTVSGPEDGAPQLRQLWSCCILARQLQIWIPKAPEVSMEAKGKLQFPQGSSLLESWYLLSLGGTFNSWVERNILILRGTANLMESKGNFHLQPASCATWPLPTLAVQGALPGTVKTRACAGGFLSVPVGPHWTLSSRIPPTWVHLFSAEQQQYHHSRYLMHQAGEKTSWKHYWGWYRAKVWRNFLDLHAKCRSMAEEGFENF